MFNDEDAQNPPQFHEIPRKWDKQIQKEGRKRKKKSTTFWPPLGPTPPGQAPPWPAPLFSRPAPLQTVFLCCALVLCFCAFALCCAFVLCFSALLCALLCALLWCFLLCALLCCALLCFELWNLGRKPEQSPKPFRPKPKKHQVNKKRPWLGKDRIP